MMQTKENPARTTLGIQDLGSQLTASILAHHGVAVTVPPTGKYFRFNDKGRMGSGGPLWAFFDGLNAVHGDWRTGESHVITNEDIDPAKAAEARRKADEAKRQYEKERRAKQAQVAAKCRDEWPMLLPAEPNHPYLVAKQVLAHNLRQKDNALVVPLSDDDRLVNFQTILPDGAKRFRSGGRITGCYHPIGTITPDDPLLICEGWATGAALHEATGYAVACSMNAGNLLPVCGAFRRRYPAQKIVVTADNDHRNPAKGLPNTGLDKGQEAARLIGAGLIWPNFNEGDEGTDYNDWLRDGGSIAL